MFSFLPIFTCTVFICNIFWNANEKENFCIHVVIEIEFIPLLESAHHVDVKPANLNIKVREREEKIKAKIRKTVSKSKCIYFKKTN